MRRTFILSIVAVAVLVAWTPLRAAEPTTKPVEPRVKILIDQLGDDNFQVRQKATDELRKFGPSALPALRQATKSRDPEVSTRAESLVKELEGADRQPVQPPAEDDDPFADFPGMQGIIIGPRGMRQQVQVRGAGQIRHVTLRENNRTVTLRENPEGIRITVTEPDATGRLQTREFKARNAEQLKKESPEGFTWYERLNNVAQIGVMRFRPRPGHLGPMRDPRGIEKMLRDQRMNLPDVFAPDVIQPAAGKFGIRVQESDPALVAQLGGGVVVSDVQPGSRADKLGLRSFDLIQKINDRKIDSVDAAEGLLVAKPPVSVELIRAGKVVKLTEGSAE